MQNALGAIQNADLSKGSNSLTTVYLTGNVAPSMPPEFNYIDDLKFFEDRYRTYYDENNAVVNMQNNNVIQIIKTVQNKFIRSRSDWVQTQLSVATPTVATADAQYEGIAAITPLPGIALTWADSILVQAGTNNTNLRTPATHNELISWLHWVSEVKKTDDTTLQWWALAGFYPVHSFDYTGGIAGEGDGDSAASNENPTDTTGWITSIVKNSPVCNYMIQAPFYVGNVVGTENIFPADPPGPTSANAVSRNIEPGYWMDTAMQKYRVDFMGNDLVTSLINCGAKVSMMCDCWNNPLCLPPIQQSISYFYPIANAVRPRYINTPQVYVNATPASVALDAQNQQTYPGITPNQQNFYWFFQTVELRADLQKLIMETWSASLGVIINFDWNDMLMTQNIINTNQLQINQIQMNGMCPYKVATAWTLGFPIQNLTANTTIPGSQNNFCPFAFGDVGISIASVTVSFPYSRTLTRTYWLYTARPQSYDNDSLFWTNTFRGVTDVAQVYYQNLFDTQGFDQTDFNDIQKNNEFNEFWGPLQNVPIGQGYYGPAGANHVQYGSHSIYQGPAAGGQTFGWNIGPHDQVSKWMLHNRGFDDVVSDFGVFVGSVRWAFQWPKTTGSPLTSIIYSTYQLSATYIGLNGSVTTNLYLG